MAKLIEEKGFFRVVKDGGETATCDIRQLIPVEQRIQGINKTGFSNQMCTSDCFQFKTLTVKDEADVNAPAKQYVQCARTKCSYEISEITKSDVPRKNNLEIIR